MIQGIMANPLPAIMNSKAAAVATSLLTAKVTMIAAATLATVAVVYYAVKYIKSNQHTAKMKTLAKQLATEAKTVVDTKAATLEHKKRAVAVQQALRTNLNRDFAKLEQKAKHTARAAAVQHALRTSENSDFAKIERAQRSDDAYKSAQATLETVRETVRASSPLTKEETFALLRKPFHSTEIGKQVRNFKTQSCRV